MAADRRREAVAERSAAVPRVVEPTAAAIHAERALFLVYPGRAVVRCSFVSAVPLVFAPFPYIAAHIENAQFIGEFQADRFGFIMAVFIVPAHFV